MINLFLYDLQQIHLTIFLVDCHFDINIQYCWKIVNMNTEKNDVVRKRQEALDAKQNEIVESLDNVSLKEVKESKEEAKQLGDSEKE